MPHVMVWDPLHNSSLSRRHQVLTELEIPHIYHSVARGSPKRPAFEAKWGVFQVGCWTLLGACEHVHCRMPTL